jgi:hypothetical protein
VISALGIYFTLRGSRTHLSMDIAAESNVLDVRHPVPDLAILFQGKDIEEGKSNLRVLTIRIVNDGESNIHENDFDSRMPFGLRIDGGRVVRAQVTGSNSSYLAENLHPQLQVPDRIVFNKIIFDKDRFVAVEAVVLHQKSDTPHITPLGKIAGLDAIAVTNSFQNHDQQSFWSQVFNGAPAIQITRGIAYALLALVTVIAIGSSIAGVALIPGAWRKRKRRRVARSFPAIDDAEREKKRKTVEKIFVEEGLAGLKHAKLSLANEEKLKEALKVTTEFYGGGPGYPPDEVRQAMIIRAEHSHTALPGSLQALFAAGLITYKDDQLTIDPDIMPLIETYIEKTSEAKDEVAEKEPPE